MFTSALPLLTRALRLDARLWRAHVFRLLFVGLIAFFVLQAQLLSFVLGAPGLQVFRSISWLNFVAITLAGVSFFATAISEEREEETLGLLRLAGIGPLTLLLGKSTSRLISALLLLLVQLPFILLAITLGGVTLHQIHAAYWALAAYLVFVANVGLFCSVACKRSGNASGLTGFLLALYLVGPSLTLNALGIAPGGPPPILQNVPQWVAQLAEIGVTVLNNAYAASIFFRLGTIMETGFSESPLSWQVTTNLAGAAVCFGLAWLLFDVFTRDRAAVSLRGNRLSARPRSRLFAPGRAWKNAFAWKDFYFGAGGRGIAWIKLAAYGLLWGAIATAFWFDNPASMPRRLGDVLAGVGFWGGAIELCLYAASVFRSELQGRTFSLLAILPIGLGSIAWSKTAGYLLALLPALTCVVLGGLLSANMAFELLDVATEPGFFVGILVFAVFLHVIVLCSLFVRWGALPLAIFLTFVLGYCLLGPIIGFLALIVIAVSGGDEEFAWVAVALAAVAVMIALQGMIRERLKTAGGE